MKQKKKKNLFFLNNAISFVSFKLFSLSFTSFWYWVKVNDQQNTVVLPATLNRSRFLVLVSEDSETIPPFIIANITVPPSYTMTGRSDFCE